MFTIMKYRVSTLLKWQYSPLSPAFPRQKCWFSKQFSWFYSKLSNITNDFNKKMYQQQNFHKIPMLSALGIFFNFPPFFPDFQFKWEPCKYENAWSWYLWTVSIVSHTWQLFSYYLSIFSHLTWAHTCLQSSDISESGITYKSIQLTLFLHCHTQMWL